MLCHCEDYAPRVSDRQSVTGGSAIVNAAFNMGVPGPHVQHELPLKRLSRSSRRPAYLPTVVGLRT